MKSKSRQLFPGLLLLFASVFVVFHEFTKPSIKTAADLSVINGHLKSYSFKDQARGHHDYVIQLWEYPTVFQIPANFLDSFAKAKFETDVKEGATIWLSIPKSSEKNLTLDKRIFIFSAHAETEKYLDEENSLQKYNSKFTLLMSAIFFLIGSGLIINWRFKSA